jgi:phage tail sheath protein FI
MVVPGSVKPCSGPMMWTATATVEILANPVCAALTPVLEKLLAVAVLDGPATTQQAYTDWRETMQSHRLIPVETAVKVGVNAVVKPASPRVIGIAVRRDHEFGGRPFHSWANQPVQGIVGPNRPIEFSLTDGATEGQILLSQNAGIIVRGEMGVETAIASGGFVFIGTDNCSEDPLWQFYHIVRGRDFIHLMFLRTLRGFLGRRNIDYGTVQDVLDTMRFALRDLKADGDIIDYKVGFTRDQNSPEQLRLGKFTVDFAAEEPPVLRHLGIRSARYRAALDVLLDDLLSQIDLAA